jgi:basic membrane protein A
MGKRAKRFLSIILVVLLTFSLTACGGAGSGTTEEEPAGVTDQEAVTSEPKGRIGVVYTLSGRGDMGFNDMTYEGAMKAAADFGFEVDHVEPKTLAEMEMAFEDMASSEEYDLIIGISFEVVDAMGNVAPDYPEQKFALIDTSLDLDNVVSYIAEEEQGAFLMGVMAGLLNMEEYKPENGMVGDKKVVGVIGAKDSEVVNRHITGYTLGAKYVNPDIEVLYDYVGSFSDAATAQTIAESMHKMGANIIYHGAGGSALGIFKAAADNNFLAMGEVSNQNHIEPDHIVASMVKYVEAFVYSAIEDVANGNFKGGQTLYLGLADGSLDCVTEGSNVKIDPKVMEIVNEVREKIISGELKIPMSKDKIDEWLASNDSYQG